MDDTSIQVFSSQQFGELRALKGSDGEPWFVAKDVCDVLEIRTDTIRRILDDDEVDETNPNTIGVAGGRNPLIVSEAGLYNLVLRSRKPEAREFKRWVTHEILPSIRRSGGYIATDGSESKSLMKLFSAKTHNLKNNNVNSTRRTQLSLSRASELTNSLRKQECMTRLLVSKAR